MVSPQPIISSKYFQFKRNKLPNGIKSLFYLSWEDALWDLLAKKKVKKRSCVLVPDYYCDDVEENIRQHGYKVGYYKVNEDLYVDKKSFQSEISHLKPSVIVIFHPVGIKSNLFSNIKWLKDVTGDTILIEDSVHRVIDPKEIKIIRKNHFVIDSLRKVVPIQGSRIFGKLEDLDFNLPSIFQSVIYASGVNFLWLLMLLLWTSKLNKLAEKVMLLGYDLIGNSKLPARGSILGQFLSNRLNLSAIENCKKKQVDYYEKRFRKITKSGLKIQEKDKKFLRGYPLILENSIANKILLALRKKGLLVRFELNNSNWSKMRKIIYLPLGVQMSIKQQKEVCTLVANTVKSNGVI